MKYLFAGIILALVGIISGCGGGGSSEKPFTLQGNRLRVSVMHLRTILPESPPQESYTITSRLWMPQSAPLLNDLRLTIPAAANPITILGPFLPSASEGANAGKPIVLYWGEGETTPKDQPQVVPTGGWLPGYVAPPGDLYVYKRNGTMQPPVPLDGAYQLSDSASFSYSWSVSGQSLPAPAEITKPPYLVANSKQPIVIEWQPVPNVLGYFVNVEADLPATTQRPAQRIIWTSARRPLVFGAVYDFTRDLLPATATSVTIPAGIFRGCEGITVNVLAHAAPYVDKSNPLKLELYHASLTSRIYVLFEQ